MTQRILIINQRVDNFGDEAAIFGLIQQIDEYYPDANISIVYDSYNNNSKLCINNKYIIHYNDIKFKKEDFVEILKYLIFKSLKIKTKLPKLNKYINIIENSNLVFISPGGANIGIYKSWYDLLMVLIVIIEGKTPIFHLNTIGKSNNFIFDLIAKYVLKHSIVFVRDIYSYDELKKWGIPVTLGTDTAFSLSSIDNSEKKYQFTNLNEYIALLPTDIEKWFRTYRNTGINKKIESIILPQIAMFCINNNYNIKLFYQSINELNEEELLKKCKNILVNSGMSEDKIEICLVNNVYEYESIIMHSKILITMRYHGNIFAIKHSIPFLSLSYENKMASVCACSNMEKFNVNLWDIINQRECDIIPLLNEILTNYPSIKEKLKIKCKMLERSSRLPLQRIYLENISKIRRI